MTPLDVRRKLSAIFSADVAGYSRLMGLDEAATVRTLTIYKEAMTRLIHHHRGRVVDSPGDNLLAEFDSVVQAVQCAFEIQADLKVRNDALPQERHMLFRIGINLGDVIVDGERIYGDGVNVAARLESLAAAGGICVSRSAFEQIENKFKFGCEELGDLRVKNIARPIGVYRIWADADAAGCRPVRKAGLSPAFLKAAGGLLALVLLAGAFFFWVEAHRPERLRSVEPPSDTVVPVSARKASIAVLPFKNLSEDQEQEYFSQGMTNDIITDLSKFHELFVIASNTVFTYKDKAAGIDQVAQELGVRYVLAGSVQKSDEKVRINVQLVDAAAGNPIWAERYTGDMKNIFSLQNDIVQAIVANLAVKIPSAERARVVQKGTGNLQAYDYLLKGYNHYYRRTRAANIQAAEMFEKALAQDPNYAEAYVALGMTEFNKVSYGWTEFPHRALDRAQEHAQRGLKLDETNSAPHHLLGVIFALRNQYEPAIGQLERALELNPNDADSYEALGWIRLWSGQTDAAVESLEFALRLDRSAPRNTLMHLGMAYYLKERYRDAIAILEKGLIQWPEFSGLHIVLAAAYAQTDRIDAAVQAASEVRRLEPFFELDSFGRALRNPSDRDKLIAGLRKAGLK
ncbi:MAG: tetratricopeptide repeat protein [Desulfobacterales bacterium]